MNFDLNKIKHTMKKITTLYLLTTIFTQSFSQKHEFGITVGLNKDIKGSTFQKMNYASEYSNPEIYGFSYNFFLPRKATSKSSYSSANFISTNVLVNKKGYTLTGDGNTTPNELHHKSYFMDISIYFQHHFFGKERFNQLNDNRFVLYGGIGPYYSFNIKNQEMSIFTTETKKKLTLATIY
jgi:hypothetical protein